MPKYLWESLRTDLFTQIPMMLKVWSSKFDIKNIEAKPFNLIIPKALLTDKFLNKYNSTQSLTKTNYNVYVVDMPVRGYMMTKTIDVNLLTPIDSVVMAKGGEADENKLVKVQIKTFSSPDYIFTEVSDYLSLDEVKNAVRHHYPDYACFWYKGQMAYCG